MVDDGIRLLLSLFSVGICQVFFVLGPGSVQIIGDSDLVLIVLARGLSAAIGATVVPDDDRRSDEDVEVDESRAVGSDLALRLLVIVLPALGIIFIILINE